MTIPLWALLGFAGWTLLTLGTTHGIYRWGRILTGRSNFAEFGDYRIEGDRGWYVRGMRAHANCIENLPVFAAIVFVMVAAKMDSRALSALSLVVVGTRVPHTLVHVLFRQTNLVVAFRSILYNIQFAAMSAMVVLVVAMAA
jgi:uncharacterized MAPEG superfamily protein